VSVTCREPEIDPELRAPSPPRASATATRSIGRSPTSPQRYADQNERDYQEFVKAIRSGRLEAREDI
jgi:hypothetical protein